MIIKNKLSEISILYNKIRYKQWEINRIILLVNNYNSQILII